MNKTPIDWYSKKHATIETATYGHKFDAAHACVDQVMDLRLTLCYLGVPIKEKTICLETTSLFLSVVDSSTKPHSKLHKRHNALSFHHVHTQGHCF